MTKLAKTSGHWPVTVIEVEIGKIMKMKCYQQVKLIRSRCKVASGMHLERESEFWVGALEQVHIWWDKVRQSHFKLVWSGSLAQICKFNSNFGTALICHLDPYKMQNSFNALANKCIQEKNKYVFLGYIYLQVHGAIKWVLHLGWI